VSNWTGRGVRATMVRLRRSRIAREPRMSTVEILITLNLLLGIAVLALLVLLLRRGAGDGDTGSVGRLLSDEARATRSENADAARALREEVTGRIGELGKQQADQLKAVERRVEVLTESNEQRLGKLQERLEAQLRSLQEGNEKKLEQMRATVDEKLQTTLEKRLGESFKQVSDRLEAVHKGLGEMQNLASGVGDLKRVLTNVKARGTWAEVQLGALLEEVLTKDQFERNVKPKPRSDKIVEYAIKLPGRDDEGSTVWLPIDSKFPQEDYQRLQEAADRADREAVDAARQGLLRAVEVAARDISSKYLSPPHTTDFGILFLPTEGLYAEVLREPGLVEKMQNKYRIVLAGPTTLTAILNSLRMGFRTLAIEKRSSEVWKVLSAVKTEFGKFGDVFAKVQKQLQSASKTIDEEVGTRTRVMERKLRQVEALPGDEATRMLDADGVTDLIGSGDEAEDD
jgi:DNA recombination protein RmuC